MPNFGLYKTPSANYVEEYQLAVFCVANMSAFDTKEKSTALVFLGFTPFWEISLHLPAPQDMYGNENFLPPSSPE